MTPKNDGLIEQEFGGITLSPEDFDQMLAVMTSPAGPNALMRQAIERYRALVGREGWDE